VATSPAITARSRQVLLICGLVPAFLVALLAVSRPASTVRLDNSVYDHMVRWAGTTPPGHDVVIVDIDERSLANHGQWPWPRDLIARLIDRLREARAAVVALDIVFPEPQRGDERADAVLAETLRAGGVILGYGLTFDERPADSRHCVLHPFSTAVVQHGGDDTEARPFFGATGAVCSLAPLASAAGASGFLNAAPDGDGILRRVPLLAELDGRVYPSLGLAAVAAHTGSGNAVVHIANDNATSLTLGDRRVPLDGKGNVLLRYRGEKRRFPYVSADDVLEGRAGSEALGQKIVLVGTTALGTREVVATPLDTLFVGVEVQATVADNLLRGDFIHRPEHQGVIESSLTLVSGFGVALLVATRGVALGTALAAGGLGGFWIAAVWLLASQGLFVSPLFPTLSWLAAFTVVGLVRFKMERTRADVAGVERGAARALMIQALLSLTEVRDAETGRHSRRTQQYTKLLAEALATHPRFRHALTPERIELLSSLAPLHDIGKVGVPDSILNKPGALTDEELAEMRRHPVYGRDVIVNAESKVQVRDDAVLSLAKEIVYTHHERWDGAGYPEGLQGEAIPIAGRIVAVVDVYDAITTRTLYRKPMSHDEVLGFIVSRQGSHFDPAVVDAFVRVAPQFAVLHEGSSQGFSTSVPTAVPHAGSRVAAP
jgi:CHASE2 domain-containing sensor protein